MQDIPLPPELQPESDGKQHQLNAQTGFKNELPEPGGMGGPGF